MVRDTLSGFPYEISKEKGMIVIRFYPKSLKAKYPNDSIFVLKLNEKELEKLQKILTN